jgi:hypothetical protein
MLTPFELDRFDLTQLAYRASNLAEQLCILKRLSECTAGDRSFMALQTADIAGISQTLEMLFPKVDRVKPNSSLCRLKRQAIKRSLHHYRWYGLNLHRLTPEQWQIFQNAQASWLPTYQRAIYTLGTHQLTEAPALQGHTPFLRLIEAELTAGLETLQRPESAVSIQPQVVASVQQYFSYRVHKMVASAIAAEGALGLALNPANAEPAVQIQAYHQFYLRFPVLARWLAQISGDLMLLIRQAITHVLQDGSDLSQRFWNGVAIHNLQNIQCMRGLNAAETQCVLRLTFGLTDGQVKQILYYPYSLDAEKGLQQFYAELLGDRPTSTTSIPLLCKPGYGYLEPARVSAQQGLLDRFQQVGQYLAVRQLLGSRRGLWGRLQMGIDPSSLLTNEDPLITPALQRHSTRIFATPPASEAQHAIQQGFESIETALQTYPYSVAALKTCFATATARLCHRPVATYEQLLTMVQTAAYLRNPLRVDTVFRTLVEQPCPWDSLGEIAQLEVKMLWQFKVLWLTVPMNHRYLLYDAEHALFSKLPLSPLMYLSRRIKQLTTRQHLPKSRTEGTHPPQKQVVQPIG